MSRTSKKIVVIGDHGFTLLLFVKGDFAQHPKPVYLIVDGDIGGLLGQLPVHADSSD